MVKTNSDVKIKKNENCSKYIYIYICIYMCVCVCVYIYIYIIEKIELTPSLQPKQKKILMNTGTAIWFFCIFCRLGARFE